MSEKVNMASVSSSNILEIFATRKDLPLKHRMKRFETHAMERHRKWPCLNSWPYWIHLAVQHLSLSLLVVREDILWGVKYSKKVFFEKNPSLHCSYISFSVLFLTKSSLVWKNYTQKLRTIFQTNSSLVWKKKLILQDTDSKPNSDWFGKFWWPLSMS